MTTVDQLTPEQIANWRKVLFGLFGSVANYLTDEEIQAYRDQMQKQADKLPEEEE